MPVRILGLDDLKRQCKEYGAKGQEILDEALYDAAEVIAEAASAAAPVGDRVHVPVGSTTGKSGYVPLRKVRFPGHLKKNITVQEMKSADQVSGVATYRAGTTLSAYYGLFLEQGTRTRRPHPFFGRTFDANLNKAMKAAADRVAKELEKL